MPFKSDVNRIAISRVDQLADHAGTYAGNDQSYTYLGLSTIVQELDGNGIELSYIKQSGESNGPSQDPYIGLDQFGRVVDQRWMPASNPSSPVDRFQYGYDQSGNVLYKNNLVNSSFSELYHANSTTSGDNSTAYDPLNRLTAFSRGTLSASGHNGSGGHALLRSPGRQLERDVGHQRQRQRGAADGL